jgi:DNA mismatch repair protein MutS2
VKQSSREATEYLRRIKREAEEAESLRQALEEERTAVAEKFAGLDREFQKRERDRQTEFENRLASAVSEFEKRARDLVARIEERADRVKVEREAEKRAAELKRETQRAAQAMSEEARQKTRARRTPSQGQEGGLPPQLRGVKVIRDGEVISATTIAPETEAAPNRGQDARATSEPATHDIQVGDRVRLLTFGSTGIVDRIKNGEAELRVGSLHMREKLSNLELVSGTGVPPVTHAQDARATSKRGSSPTVREGVRTTKGTLEDMRRQAATTELHLHSKSPDSKFQNNELNLIGKTTDEAVDLTDKFLDAAFLNGLNEVRIIHGHGTGALRKAITEFLKEHPHVAKFASAPQDKGGSGATQVELKS